MVEPRVRIRFDGNGGAYHPGETLSGEYRLESIHPDDVQAIEVSVLWFTEGKGDEDLAVHHFERSVFGGEASEPPPVGDEPAGTRLPGAKPTGTAANLRRPIRFSTVLPNSPLSYYGVIVKLHWCVRVRVFLTRGKPIVAEREFQLGGVPAVTAQVEAGAETDGAGANGTAANGNSATRRSLRSPRPNGNGTNRNGNNGNASAIKAAIV